MEFTRALLNEFIESRRAGTSPLTIETYQRRLSGFKGCELTSDAINKYLQELDQGNGKRECFRVIRVAVNWLSDTGQLVENPMMGVSSPKCNKNTLPCITQEQLVAIAAACPSVRDKCIVLLLFRTGLRVSELAAIELHDINWARGSIKVQIKGGETTEAFFEADLGALMLSYLGDRKRGSLFKLTVRGIQDVLSRLSTTTGIEITAHAFRRGMCVDMQKAGQPNLNIQRAGRWKNPHMVELYASSLTQEDARPALGDALGNIMGDCFEEVATV